MHQTCSSYHVLESQHGRGNLQSDLDGSQETLCPQYVWPLTMLPPAVHQGSSKEADEWVEQALHQNAVLQEHLQTYASRSIPIVQLTLADFTTRLDTLHDYLLQCMEAAMSRQ